MLRKVCIAAAIALAGCGNLLPHVRTEQHSQFASFEAARAALQQVVPYRTTLAELKTLGFDVEASRNVRRIGYPQIIGVLTPNQNLPAEQADVGIRDCIASREACRAFEFQFGTLRRQRLPPVLLDLLNFRRETHITGWRFEGLVVMRDGVVLFASFGGVPRIDRIERRVNPLGPFQSGSDMAAPDLWVDRAAGAALLP